MSDTVNTKENVTEHNSRLSSVIS